MLSGDVAREVSALTGQEDAGNTREKKEKRRVTPRRFLQRHFESGLEKEFDGHHDETHCGG